MNRSIVIIGAPCWTHRYPFYALGVIAGMARDAGFEFHVYDMNIDFYHHVAGPDKRGWEESRISLWAAEGMPGEILERYKSWVDVYLDSILALPGTGLVCFSVNTFNRYFSRYAAAYLKARRPDLTVMFGGIDCFAGEYNKKFLEEKGCDIICQGEAEICFRDFLKEYKATGDFRTAVKGFAYKAAAGGITDTGEAELPALKDGVPLPDYTRLDFSRYTGKNDIPIYSSRGCINRCSFCSESPNFKCYRFRKAEDVFREVRYTLSFIRGGDVPTLHFADSLINGNIAELERFADLVLESGLKINWGGQAAIRPQMTTELLEKLAKSGCVSFFWGMESASGNVLRRMHKPNDIKLYQRILDDCFRFGIKSLTPTIVGFPGETPADAAVTIDFILKNRKKTIFSAPGLAMARKKSPLYERYAEFGLKAPKEYDWETADGTNNILTRVFRRFIFFQASHNRNLGLEDLRDHSELDTLDMNDPQASTDYILTLHELARLTGTLPRLRGGVEGLPGAERYRAAQERMGDGRLEKGVSGNEAAVRDYIAFFCLDKNSPEARKAVYQLTLDLLGEIEQNYNGGVSCRTADIRVPALTAGDIL